MRRAILMWYKRTKFTALACLTLLAMLLVGCIGVTKYTSASLGDIVLSSGVDKQLRPIDTTTVFNSDVNMIYCSFGPTKLPVGTKITARWVYSKGEVKELANYLIEEWHEVVKKEGSMAMFIRRPTNGWPKGTYNVVLFIDDREEIRVPFTIK